MSVFRLSTSAVEHGLGNSISKDRPGRLASNSNLCKMPADLAVSRASSDPPQLYISQSHAHAHTPIRSPHSMSSTAVFFGENVSPLGFGSMVSLPRARSFLPPLLLSCSLCSLRADSVSYSDHNQGLSEAYGAIDDQSGRETVQKFIDESVPLPFSAHY
jgi:hypothetical protein